MVKRFCMQATVQKVEKIFPLLSSHNDAGGHRVDEQGAPYWRIIFTVGPTRISLSFDVNSDPELVDGAAATLALQVDGG